MGPPSGMTIVVSVRGFRGNPRGDSGGAVAFATVAGPSLSGCRVLRSGGSLFADSGDEKEYHNRRASRSFGIQIFINPLKTMMLIEFGWVGTVARIRKDVSRNEGKHSFSRHDRCDKVSLRKRKGKTALVQ